MVEDRITDSRRVAQLLASELSGLETGPLADVSVVDADPGAAPSPEGTVAYAIADGEDRVGEVSLYPDSVRLRLSAGASGDTVLPSDDESAPPVSVESTDGELVMAVEYGAGVKRAVDVVRSRLATDPDRNRS